MKIYVSVEMEGVAGVVREEEVTRGNADYEAARRTTTDEALALAAGAREAGATEVWLSEGHSRCTNLVLDDCPAWTRIVRGVLRPWGMLEGLDRSFAGVAWHGYHAARGTRPAVLDHTYSASAVRLDGKPVGELGLNLLLAAYHGVPSLLVSGDRATCDEVLAFQPDAEAVVTKEAISRYAGVCKPPQLVHDELRAAMGRAAVRARAGVKPPPAPKSPRIEIDFMTSEEAELASWIPGAERIGGRTVALAARDMPAAYRFFLLTQWLGYSLRSVK